MPALARHRFAALFALALAWSSALPLASFAESDACCGAAAGCSETEQSPCTQLAAAPCCAAPSLPIDASFAPPTLSPEAFVLAHPPSAAILCELRCDARPPRASLADSVSLRTVMLRL